MKYASFLSADGSPTWGVIVDGRAYDLGPTGANLAPTLRAAVEQGIFGTWARSSAPPPPVRRRRSSSSRPSPIRARSSASA